MSNSTPAAVMALWSCVAHGCLARPKRGSLALLAAASCMLASSTCLITLPGRAVTNWFQSRAALTSHVM
jgi:hypothetical protein